MIYKSSNYINIKQYSKDLLEIGNHDEIFKNEYRIEN